MGCKNSTTRTTETPAPPGKSGSDAARNVNAFLRVVMKGYHDYLEQLGDEVTQSVKETLALVFMNSCVDVVHNNFRMKSDVVVSTVRGIARDLHLAICETVADRVEEHAVDDGLSRLLNAWLAKNKEGTAAVPPATAVAMLASIDVTQIEFLGDVTFHALVKEFYAFHKNAVLDKIFYKYSDGKETMPDENYSRFLSDVQGTAASTLDAHEKIRSRFGGAMTKYAFSTYESRSHSNFILDPRSRDVWQDMMEPLPNYMVRTQSIHSREDLESALQQGVRAFVVHCVRNDAGVVVTGTLPLRELLETLKAKAFATNTYPVIICLDPTHRLSKDVQETVATDITEVLGSSLARGLMFDGASINDPQYSPAALQKKFLLMGTQAPLKPFVGFLVADMNRVGLGVRVTDVKDATPAAKAGIVKDDWLTHINGEAIQDKQHLKRLLVGLQLGQEFTMKKENLDEVRVVVGGAIPEDDKDSTKHLSDLIYLKFSDARQEDLDSMAPWETSAAHVSDMHDSPEKRQALQHHLVFLSDAETVEETPDGRRTTEVSNLGVQFMDNAASRQLHIWSQGKFAENAHCGYVLKCNVLPEGRVHLRLRIDFLSAPHHLRDDAILRSVAATIYGSGKVAVTPEKSVLLDVDNESAVVAFTLEYESKGATHRLVGSFPAHLIRIGYRGMPVVYENEVLSASTATPYDVLCFITQREPAAA